MKVKHIYSQKDNYWKAGTVSQVSEDADTLELTCEKRQVYRGCGGCFNELGYEMLMKLPAEAKDKILDDLFGEDGLAFSMGRLPIGANDYSLEWYSCCEDKDDYDLKNFNINRDKIYTIPYIKEALNRQPELELFASPWSPPAWMKTFPVYNFGRIRIEDKVLQAYAKYFVRFIEEYEKEGITINQIHVQNEPMADQKFPSCLWNGEDMLLFIRDYLGPELEKSGLNTELWLGTINGPFHDFMTPGAASMGEFYDQFANTILSDRKAREYLTGVGVQWGGKHIVEQVEISYPEMKIMQTECECGDGENTWEHAEYVFGLMWHYFYHRAESFLYWNMVLQEGGISTWGWKQNSLVTIDSSTLEVKYNPEFYVMKHLSASVKKGARLIKAKGHWASNSICFENPDGEIIILVGNNMNRPRKFTFINGDQSFSADIEPHSIHSFGILTH